RRDRELRERELKRRVTEEERERARRPEEERVQREERERARRVKEERVQREALEERERVRRLQDAARPLTPQIVSVTREPKWSDEDDWQPQPFKHSNSLKRETHDTQSIIDKSQYYTAPVPKEAAAAAAAAVLIKESKNQRHDPIQE